MKSMLKNTMIIGGMVGMGVLGASMMNKSARKKAEKIIDEMLVEANNTISKMN